MFRGCLIDKAASFFYNLLYNLITITPESNLPLQGKS
ncbi:hypothetical protein BA6E_125498 [Bacteroidales bacterium 6E]|nr:hypothetical protein BA6E_125498 [Bacteroidales bacterium 6E]